MKNLNYKNRVSLSGKVLLAIFCFILLYSRIHAAYAGPLDIINPVISEIMFNPQGSDSNNEWIEVHSAGCVNLSSYRFFEDNVNHKITPFLSNGSQADIFCGYAIITSSSENFIARYMNSTPGTNATINAAVYESSFSLNNNGEIIALKLDDAFVDYVNYSLMLAQVSVPEGYSLDYSDGVWMKSQNIGGNPGAGTQVVINDTSNTPVNETINNTHNMTFNVSINATINESIPGINATINTTINETINETTNISLNTTINITDAAKCLANITINIKNETRFYMNKESIKFQSALTIWHDNETSLPKNYTIEYWIEDMFTGIVKAKISTTNQEYKSYTPSISEKDKVLMIRNKIVNIDGCYMEDAESEKIIIVINKDGKDDENSDSSSSSKKSSSKTAKPAECKPYAPANSTCSATPLVKIVNVCNNTGNMLEEKNASSESYSSAAARQDKELHQSASNPRNNTDSSSKISGNIVYESVDHKNKTYATIGILIIAAVVVSLLAYNRRNKSRLKST